MSTESLPDRGGKPAWSLNASSFERLLAALHPDRDRAALEYERLRERISGLLKWWGALRPAELADQTLDRVARRLEEGAEIRPGSLGAFVRGVARMVFYESARDHEAAPLPDHVDPAAPVSDAEKETALACLDRCLETVAPKERTLILRYYDDGRGKKIESRRLLAGELGISMTALRIRTHRLREGLERCVSACCETTMKRSDTFRHP